MAFLSAKQILRRSLSNGKESAKTQKGHVAVYVGEEERKRYSVPVSYLNQPLFHDLLSLAEEEFRYEHPMGGLTIPFSAEGIVITRKISLDVTVGKYLYSDLEIKEKLLHCNIGLE